ncbi:hypothetical protein N9P30_02230 [Alphaproteobacteria bacterium]|nr:hypothetical protein [Alphaproteobacteria bacterium]
MEQLSEFQLWSMFGTMSIAFALRAIGVILLIWLALRIAANIRASDEVNVFMKLLGTGFGVISVASAFYWQTAYAMYRANTANYLVELQAGGTQVSPGGTGFANSFATTDPVTSPAAIIIAFDVIVLLMILGQIWSPKKA